MLLEFQYFQFTFPVYPHHPCNISRYINLIAHFSLQARFYIRVFFYFSMSIVFVIVTCSFLRVPMLFNATYMDTQVRLHVAGPVRVFSSTRLAISLRLSLKFVYYLAPQETFDVAADPLVIFSLFLDLSPPSFPKELCLFVACCVVSDVMTVFILFPWLKCVVVSKFTASRQYKPPFIRDL